MIYNDRETMIKDHLTVADLLKFLPDCRPDAEVFVSLFSDSTGVDKIRKIMNRGNYVQLVREL